ncbi:hypothetical protein N0V88_005100 [Collariella sp. IMI 366227]|nr:hypothetical protein N0V88_005100 [Collariella sp. IMI 366227]
MVSVAELLNPEPPRAPLPSSRPAPASPARRGLAFRPELALARRSIEMVEHTRGPSRHKVKGAVNFPPFESLDEPSLREVRRFQVHPFGTITDTCKRIPYNSGKKDFFSKTGREAFDVFCYDFKVPGDDASYTVMWDYSVGLVRMTPFFKCRGYSKTTPAKMLNQNPGLKDITHSITGGAIKAQGYWMPFSCAKAICATFCHKISGALIPLFGPRFPFECIPENATGYGRMVINPEIVAQARRDATAMFRTSDHHDYYSDYDQRLLLSPYGDDTDVDCNPGPCYARPRFPNVPPLRIPARPPLAPAPVPTPMHSPAKVNTINKDSGKKSSEDNSDGSGETTGDTIRVCGGGGAVSARSNTPAVVVGKAGPNTRAKRRRLSISGLRGGF